MSVNKELFYTYDELKKIVIQEKIKGKDDYVKKYKSLQNFGKRAPINPSSFYGNDVWISWSIFLDKPIEKKKHHNIYYSYFECKKVIQFLKIKSKSDFFIRINDILNEDIKIPYNPYKVYKEEWEGWGIFLGTGRIQDNQKKYLKYDEAKKWVQSLNLKMSKEWKRLNLNKLPEGIPKKPERTYKKTGWVNYYDWLGIDEKDKISFGEKKIFDFLNQNKINFRHNKSLMDCKHQSKLRFDFYIPEKNICIEFDGIQHYKEVDFFGGKEEFIKTQYRDKIKDLFCISNEIKLIRIPYYLTDNEIIETLNKELL